MVASKRLHIHQSELNRMRWFAHLSKGKKSFWGDIPPSDRSWTRFKTILPRLIAAVKGGPKPNARMGNTRSSSVINGVLRSIRSAASKLRSEGSSVNEAKKNELIRDLRDFASAVANRVGIRFRLEVEDETGGQGSVRALAEFDPENGPNSSQLASIVTV
jgi:hypothetical protein